MDDISKALALEVKKEIADRYFGFRKQIENDTSAYLAKIAETALNLENNVGFDLIRIYSLLQGDHLINEFIRLTGFESKFFFDSYVNNSPTIRKRVFASRSIRGFTGKRRFKNLFYDTYEELYTNIHEFHETMDELTEEYEVIEEQIKIFYRKNDICMIMQFFRSFDNLSFGKLDLSTQEECSVQSGDLEKKLRIVPPPPAVELLPDIPIIPQLHTIKPELEGLINKAFDCQQNSDPKCF